MPSSACKKKKKNKKHRSQSHVHDHTTNHRDALPSAAREAGSSHVSKVVCFVLYLFFFFFFFNDTATTEIYTLSLHDALPIFFNEERNSDLDASLQLCWLG